MSTTNIGYKDLRRKLEARYFVQWITATNRHGEIVVLGWCVRDEDWNTMFKHEDETVCRKVCEMLNENEEGANKC